MTSSTLIGGKIKLDHNTVTVENLETEKDKYLKYLRQDIHILGAVMVKAKEIYWDLYEIDILTQLTISSLGMAIFRRKYYNDSEERGRIGILSANQDKFIRRGRWSHRCIYTIW